MVALNNSSKFFFGALLLFGAMLAGCVQTTPQPSPTASPTVFPTVLPSPSAIPSPSPEPTAEPHATPLEIERLNNSQLQPGDAFLTVLTPDSFTLTASMFAGTPCSESTAYRNWTSTEGEVQVHFKHAQPPGVVCIEVLESRTFSVTLDFALVSFPLKRIKVFNNGELLKAFEFEGMFCGGIAAFQCPSAFECKLDGSYPDAGGKCTMNKTSQLLSGPLELTVGQEFKINLFSNPSTGFDWQVSMDNNYTLEYVGSKCLACGNGSVLGAGSDFEYRFKAVKPGVVTVLMEYARPWDPASAENRTQFQVVVS
ncbi:MAG: protease inhibitor I42 family protein [Candidatus Micrarchaeota archaeon]